MKHNKAVYYTARIIMLLTMLWLSSVMVVMAQLSGVDGDALFGVAVPAGTRVALASETLMGLTLAVMAFFMLRRNVLRWVLVAIGAVVVSWVSLAIGAGDDAWYMFYLGTPCVLVWLIGYRITR